MKNNINKRLKYVNLSLDKLNIKNKPTRKELILLIKECMKLTDGFEEKVKINTKLEVVGNIFWEAGDKMSIHTNRPLWDSVLTIRNKKKNIEMLAYELESYAEKLISDKASKYDKLINKFTKRCNKLAYKYKINKDNLINVIYGSTCDLNIWRMK